MDKIASLSIVYFLIGGAIVAALIHLSKLETQSQIKTKIEAAKGQVSTQEKQLQTAQNLELEKPKLEAEILNKKEIFQAALETMPIVTNHRDILESVSSEAKVAGVRVVQLKPKDAPKEVVNIKTGGKTNASTSTSTSTSANTHDESQYEIELEASYTQLSYLFYLLTKIKPNIGFKNINVIKKDFLEGMALLSCKATLVAYKYKEPQAKPIAPIGKPGVKPAVPPPGVKK